MRFCNMFNMYRFKYSTEFISLRSLFLTHVNLLLRFLSSSFLFVCLFLITFSYNIGQCRCPIVHLEKVLCLYRPRLMFSVCNDTLHLFIKVAKKQLQRAQTVMCDLCLIHKTVILHSIPSLCK